MSFSMIEEVLPGLEYERSYQEAFSIIQTNMGRLPQNFPLPAWNDQIERYLEYWSWWQGDILNETLGETAEGETLYKYPLKINSVRTYSRIHNAMLWGEVPEDDAAQLVRAKVKPEASLFSEEVTDEQKQNAKFYERVIGKVWEQSDGRAICWEAGLNSQFLGGAYFQLKYQPWRTDLAIPIVIRYLKPDFVLPVWGDDPWELLEAYVVYRMTPAAAETEFNKPAAPKAPTHITYIEHWTKDRYSIYLDGEPLEATYYSSDGKAFKMSYNNAKNPFGFVPIYYFPRMREGNFYGPSLVPDVMGMSIELNSRLADHGDVIRQNNERVLLGRNITSTPTAKGLGPHQQFYDLGQDIITGKNPADVWALDPPTLSAEMGKFIDDVSEHSDRNAFISRIAYGEDEGSQRSGITLQIRMWPTISMARAQRGFWSTGFRHVNAGILRMLATIGFKVDGHAIPSDVLKTVTLTCQWYPFLPRDEEQLTNRIVLLTQSGNMSLERSLELQGDVEDIELEAERIRKRQAEQAAMTQGNNQGADTELESPVATTDVQDGE